MTTFRCRLAVSAIFLLAACGRQSGNAVGPTEHDYSGEAYEVEQWNGSDVMNVINTNEPDRAKFDTVQSGVEMRSEALANQAKLIENVQKQSQITELQRRVDQLEMQQPIDAANHYPEHVRQ